MKLVVYLHLLSLSLTLKYAIQYTLRKNKKTSANRHYITITSRFSIMRLIQKQIYFTRMSMLDGYQLAGVNRLI